MPWINEDMCVGCELCVDDCPVGAISMENSIAEIDDSSCIRCGQCHDVCPQDAVRHDGEKIPEEIADNMDWVRELLAHYDEADEREAFIERMKRYFGKQRKVANQTIEQLEAFDV